MVCEILRSLLLVHICKQKDHNLAADAPLPAQLAAGGGSKIRYGLMQLFKGCKFCGKRSGDTYLRTLRSLLLKGYAGLSTQLFPGLKSGYGKLLSYNVGRHPCKVQCALYAVGLQEFQVPSAYSPYIPYIKFAKHLLNILLSLHKAASVKLGVLFA